MTKTIRIAVIFVCINLVALDAIFYTVDRELRAYRDRSCDLFEHDRLVEKVGHHVYPEKTDFFFTNPWSTASFTLISLTHKDGSINFYGCDANGHRYRLWRKQN